VRKKPKKTRQRLADRKEHAAKEKSARIETIEFIAAKFALCSSGDGRAE
jgi:hypothetical protein